MARPRKHFTRKQLLRPAPVFALWALTLSDSDQSPDMHLVMRPSEADFSSREQARRQRAQLLAGHDVVAQIAADEAALASVQRELQLEQETGQKPSWVLDYEARERGESP